MNIVTVYPIIRGAFKDELTYWSSHSFRLGSIIEVPLRGRTIAALVGDVLPANHAKSNIKQASFITRKIEKTKEIHVVRQECIKACVKISELYAVPLGSVLKACIPDVILQESINAGGSSGTTTSLKNKNKESEKKDTEQEDTHTPNTVSRSMSVSSDVLVYQTNTEDRLSTYKSIVREEFARRRSVLIIAPTVMSALELHTNLQKGIEDYVVVLHGSLSKKKQSDIWNTSLKSTHPLLIITTPLFSSIPRTDIQTIVLERESSRAYSAIRTPYIDYRDYIEKYAQYMSARLIYGDTLLRVETLYRRETGELSDFFPISYRVEKSAELLIIDTSNADKIEKKNGIHESVESTHKAKEKDNKKKGFQIFSEELRSMIEYTSKKSLPMFIFTARRGLSPQTVCGDCGTTVECLTCHAPIVLHQKKSAPIASNTHALHTSHAPHASSASKHATDEANRGHDRSPNSSHSNLAGYAPSENAQNSYRENDNQGHMNHGNSHPDNIGINPNRFFLCHHCGTERSAVEACTSCGSWKLITLGIGIETVADEIKKLFPKREIFRLDKDTVKTDKQAQTVIRDFKESKDGILLGTESSLAFLPEIEYSAIASLDSLFSIPDFKINERITHTVLRILEKTSKYVLVQTRNSKNSLLKHIASANLLNLYREEISMRRMLNYPPFMTHVKITIEDTRSGATEKMRRVQQLLEECEQHANIEIETLVFPAFVPTAKGKSTLHLLLSIKKKDWPNEEFRALLMSLPKEYAVRVNPESLL